MIPLLFMLAVPPEMNLLSAAPLLAWCESSAPATSQRCHAYVAGFVEAAESLGYESAQPFCVPMGKTYDDHVVTVRKFLRENRDRLSETRGLLVLEALRKAYPCRK
jgi:hypothetical protein